MREKFEELVKNEEFMNKLETLNNEQEIVELFREYDVQLSTEEFEKMSASDKDELNETSLDDVVGGTVFYYVGRAIARWIRNKYNYSSGSGNGGGFSAGGGSGGGGGGTWRF